MGTDDDTELGMKGKAMAASSKGPRIVDVLAEIARELRLSNRMRALTLPASALEENSTSRASTAAAKARVARKNELRAEVRQELGLEVEGVRDGDRA
ncbi:MAG: hypothetical protein K0S70_819 [Microbacterium sp.]|nr:hypothetical protein [Microbacterium sp.]